MDSVRRSADSAHISANSYFSIRAAIEGEVEKALLAAGCIKESNFGELSKLGWTRSSRTDKGVHSVASVVSLKLEVPMTAWEQDPDGADLAASINCHLASDIRVLGVVPVTRSFSARRSCKSRSYVYLMPVAVLGIKEHQEVEEVREVLDRFQNTLRLFQGNHPFHNYTARKQYREQPSYRNRSSPRARPEYESESESESASESDTSTISLRGNINVLQDANFLGTKIGDASPHLRQVSDEEEQGEVVDNIRNDESGKGMVEGVSASNLNSGLDLDSDLELDLEERNVGEGGPMAWWVGESGGVDKIGSAHYRSLSKCTCGEVESHGGVQFVRIHLTGDSFMLHQIRKIVGTAVALMRGRFPEELIPVSLVRYARVVLPLAPAEGLILSANEFHPFRKPPPPKTTLNTSLSKDSGSSSTSEPLASQKPLNLKMSQALEASKEALWSSFLLPHVVPLLKVSEEPWKTWLLNIDTRELVPKEEVIAVLEAWVVWRQQAIGLFGAGSKIEDDVHQ